MRSVLALGVVLLLFAAPAFAGDGNVPQGTLSSLGLGDMQVVSDAQGMQVRGLASSFGEVKGTSLIFGQLLTPDTKNFVVGSSVNEVDANAETTAIGALTLTKTHGVTLDLILAVDFPDLTSYLGQISGIATGAGSVSIIQP
jgi:opacity protein-like surface antigen